MKDENKPPNPWGLTPRQFACVQLSAAGVGYDEIARRLCVAPDTVHTHLRLAYARMSAKNKVEAASLFVRGMEVLPLHRMVSRALTALRNYQPTLGPLHAERVLAEVSRVLTPGGES